jgi:hypothetical protein
MRVINFAKILEYTARLVVERDRQAGENRSLAEH